MPMNTSIPVEDRQRAGDAVPAIRANPGEEVDLIGMLIPLLQAKRFLAMWTLLFALLGAIVAFIVRPVYTAEAVIMPPQQQSSATSLIMGQLGALSSLGGGAALGLKNPADMFIGILESRSIADNLTKRFDLSSVYGEKTDEQTRKKLASNTNIESSKDGLIHIMIKDHDAKRAASLANAYVDELYAINSRLAIGEASQRRLFFDQQLAKENIALAAAEDALKKTEEKTGVIQLSGQAQITLSSIANLQAQIASREVELGVARTFATDENPDVQRLLQEIVSLKRELSSRETAQQAVTPGNVQVPAGSVPSVGLEYLRKQRDVQYHEALFALLLKQREAASLDEAKSAPLIQVVDSAVAPERKSGPSRALIVIGLAMLGLMLAIGWLFLKSLIAGLRRDPRQEQRLHELRGAMRS